ncbi:MAG: hypothetical protein LBR11_09485 [Deltaproteobacteria bacterium]|jgi:hypothetical protein|nr:hypothetical protein [Deltaproteobacteria bacterium]
MINNINYSIFSDEELIELWYITPLNSLNRLKIYIEFSKRNKLELLNSIFKNNGDDNEFLCAKFKANIPLMGCITDDYVFLIIGYLICFFGIFLLGTRLFYTFNLSYYEIISKIWVYTCVYIIVPILIIYFIANIFISSYLIVTNKNIYVYVKILFLIKFLHNKIKLNNIIITEFKYIILNYIRYYIRYFGDKDFAYIAYWTHYKYDKIIRQWLYILSVGKYKCYLYSPKFEYSDEKDDKLIYNYKTFDIIDFFYVIEDVNFDVIFEAFKDKILFLNFINLILFLDCLINKKKFKTIIELSNKDYLLEDEGVILKLPTVDNKYLLVTNLRLIILSKRYKYLNSYDYEDKDLKLYSMTFQFALLYKREFVLAIPWRKINVPLLDLFSLFDKNAQNNWLDQT